MGLDIRWPIGIMFALIGALLVVYGAVTNGNAELYARSLGMNINLRWGVVLLGFGAVMLAHAWKAQRASPPAGGGSPK